MSLLAGIVGALVGLFVGTVFAELTFGASNNRADVIPFVLAVVGWLGARALVRRRRKPAPGSPRDAPDGG